MRKVFSQVAGHQIVIALACVAFAVEDHRGAGVGGVQHGLGFGNDTQQVQAEDLLHILDTEHLAFLDPFRGVAGQQQVLPDRLAIVLGAVRLARQDSQHTVRIAHRGDFRIGDDDSIISEIHGHDGPVFDAGGGVADDVVESFTQLIEYAANAFEGQSLFVAGLRGGQDVELAAALVFDQGLIEIGFALDDVDEVIHHAPLAAQNEVEIAQAHVEVDDRRAKAAFRQSHGEGTGGGGLADAALARSNYDDSCQVSLPAHRLCASN